MKKLLHFLFFIIVVKTGYCQPTRYGNEWIDYTKTYCKVYVTADGIYHIPFSLLNTKIPNLSSVNPANFIMIHNGVPVPIYVYTDSTNRLDSAAYIEFFGKKNIGDVDSVLYWQSGLQPHTFYSSYTDTSVYFFTVNNSTNNPRFTYVNNDTAAIPSLTQDMYFWYNSVVFYTAANGTFTAGRDFYTGADYLYKSLYDRNEAWGKGWINYDNTGLSVSLPTSSVYTAGPPDTIKADIFTRSWEPHNIVTTLNGTAVQTLNFDNSQGGYDYNLIVQPGSNSSLLATNTFKVTETAVSTSTEENLLVYSEITYPRMFAFDNDNSFEFNLQPGNGERYFQVSNFNDGGTQPLLYDVTNGYIIRSTDAPGASPKNFVIPAANGYRELYIRDNNASTLTVLTRLDTETFQNYTAIASQGNYIVISNKALYADSMGHNPVQDYVNYRNRTYNPSVGHIDAVLLDIDQVTDQFGYGVKQSPLGIRNLVEYAYDHWSKKPQYLFLIGKSVMYYLTRAASANYNMTLVPTFGQPASDNLLACRRGSNRPLLAVGRLAARTPADVENYLNKMISYENLQNTFGDPHQNKEEKLWMKQILDLSGGADVDEQVEFAQFVGAWNSQVDTLSYGANVNTIYKTTSNAVDNSEINTINNIVDSGISLMTVFGHAAANTFDINVTAPEQWVNSKYPMIFSNGCDVGAISQNTAPGLTETFGERFVLVPGKGAIGFTATADLSVASSLDDYGTFVYQGLSQNLYTQPWGKTLQFAQKLCDSIDGTNDFDMMVAYEMTLHGDPALTLNQYNLPDYQIDQTSVFYTPTTITASLDSFKMNIIVTNLGRAIHDSMPITITRSYTDANNPLNTLTNQYVFKVRTTYYQDTFTFKLPTFPTPNQGYGQNTFTVFVESDGRIPELSKTNNGENVQYSIYIQTNDVLPIYPYNFAIVPKQHLTVKASTSNPFAPLQTYRLQVDTSALFHHPLAQTSVRQIGGVIHWTLPITFTDSTVYYWRVSRDSISDSVGYNWHPSSFLYLKNEYPGWNQSHYYQYQQDNYPDDVYLASDRTFKFVPSLTTITATTGYCTAVGSGGPPYFAAGNLNWSIQSANDNGIMYDYHTGSCYYAYPVTNGGFTFAVIDTITGNIWQSINTNAACNFGQYGNIDCGGTAPPQYGFDFSIVGQHNAHYSDITNPRYDTMSWPHVIDAFLDSIPSGDVILMYAVSEPPYTTLWAQDSNLVNRLASMGATGLRLLCDPNSTGYHASAPYIFWTMKGNPSWGSQVIGQNYSTPLSATFSYNTLFNKGTYVSPTIGPAENWGSFHWRWRPKAHPAADKQHVDIVGVQPNGTQTTLLSTSTLDTTLAFINAKTYPNIFLRMNVENDTAHVPSQLYYWRVLYKTMPEAAINPAAYFSVQRDTIGLGDSLNVAIAIENVTDISMDSLRTKYTVSSIQTGAQQSVIIKQDSLRANDTLILRFKQQELNTNITGRDQLLIEANPEDALHQPEEYHFNNYAVVNFNTTGDNVNPLLDVTFDDRRIMNGDIVSAKPDILISIRDNSQFLAINDTSEAQIYIRYPGQTVPTLFNYDNNILTFIPASGNLAQRNQAQIIFKPTFTLDGSYDLLIRDKDRSGNYSSSSNNRYEGTTYNGVYYDYKITFNIITKAMITNVLNYPNPFSTRTQFVFTLTGSQVPDYMKIQIMTITGKVVKEITKEQLGDIHVGTNLTSYYWDGRDQYGNKLANGVYFYRVIADINNQQMDHMSSTDYGQFFDNTNIDKYFKNGFGKLVIMR